MRRDRNVKFSVPTIQSQDEERLLRQTLSTMNKTAEKVIPNMNESINRKDYFITLHHVIVTQQDYGLSRNLNSKIIFCFNIWIYVNFTIK